MEGKWVNQPPFLNDTLTISLVFEEAVGHLTFKHSTLHLALTQTCMNVRARDAPYLVQSGLNHIAAPKFFNMN